MRNFKIFLWIFVIFLIQTVVLSSFHIMGAVPSLVLGFIICVMISENEFRTAMVITVICSVSVGAICTDSFVFTTLFYVYASIIVFSLRKKPAYVNDYLKALVWTFIISAIVEVVLFALDTMSVNVRMLLYDALPTAAVNTILTAVLYPLLRKTLYNQEKRKKLLIS